MNKNEFLELLNKKLNTLSKKEKKERVSFSKPFSLSESFNNDVCIKILYSIV